MEATLRLGLFIGLFVLLALLEHHWPARPRQRSRLWRYSTHLLLSTVNVFLIRLCWGTAALGTAQWAAQAEWGLFHIVSLPQPLVFVLSLFGLDLLLYGQHRLMHQWPWLWRLHAFHHADRELDVSSGLRFHPLEALFSMGVKMAGIALLGAPVEAVLSFELALNLCALFNHANWHLPAKIQRFLQPVLICPADHRLHHDRERVDHAPNFGFSLPWWDQLFGSYLRADGKNEPAELGV